MQLDNIANNSDLFAKLANMEEQVSKLTSELAIDQETISKLKQLVTEKQARISELESALMIAQQTLTDKVLQQIRDYQYRLNERAIVPALQQIQQQIEKIQQLITEVRAFIDTQIVVINNTIRRTSIIVSDLPAQAKDFFSKAYAEIITSKINELIETMNQYIEKIKELIEQKVIAPVKIAVDKIIMVGKKKSMQLQISMDHNLLDKSAEAINEFFDALLFSGKVVLKDSIDSLNNAISNLLTNLKQMIQNSRLYNVFNDSIASIRHPSSTEAFV